MRQHLAVTALAALLAVPLFAARADALPEDQDFFTDFENVNPNTAPGDIIAVGVSPTTANLGGNAFGGRIGLAALYHSGVRSWMVQVNGTGVITFETDAAVVEFWARVLSTANDDTVITAFDGLGAAIGSDVTLSPGSGWQLVSLTGNIASIEVVNFATDDMNGIDDFGFTPVPEPGALLMLLSGGAFLAVLGRRRYAP
jgi:hypothetical protein